MDAGEMVTRWTIRLALALFAGALALWLAGHGPRARIWARRAWNAGFLLYLAHVAAAFHFFHDWSHQAAWQATARQTAETIGWHWGGGLLFNHAFTLVWLADCLWQWLGSASSQSRTGRAIWMGRAFMAFMAVNATVVFETGPTRWVALATCCALAAAWLVGRRPYR
jgi:hypothetical protein